MIVPETEKHVQVYQRPLLLLFSAQEGDRRAQLATTVHQMRALLSLVKHSSLYEEGNTGRFFIAWQAMTSLPAPLLAPQIQRIGESNAVHIEVFDLEEAVETVTWIQQEVTVAVEELLFGKPLSLNQGVRRLASDLAIPLEKDLQNGLPAVHMRLGRVGVVGLKKTLLLGEGEQQQRFPTTFDLYADLDATRAGMHISRFSDALEDVIDALGEQAWPKIEVVAEHLATTIMEKQQVLRADVSIHTTYPLQKWTPMSGRRTQEIYGLVAQAVVTEQSCKRLIGVEVEGMVACPCAQEMVHSFARGRLQEEGFEETAIEKMLSLTPLATHNQRGRATLLIGTDQMLDASDLVTIAEQAMSAENYALLKRPDELYLVKKAHAHPRFVEDVVREMLRSVVEHYPDLSDDTFVWGRQRNEETIHKYDVEAEGWGTLGELRREILQKQRVLHHTTREEWWEA